VITADTNVEPRHLPALDAGNLDLPTITAEALEALAEHNDPPTLFRFGGMPVRLERDEFDAPVIRPLTEDRTRHVLARAADWYTLPRKGGRQPALPPVHVVRDCLAHERLPFPILVRIVEAPVFGRDGKIHSTPGYSATSRLYLAPSAALRVPRVSERPTSQEVDTARDVLVRELLGDFPFVGDSERAHAIAIILTGFMRDMIAGSTPLFLIEKPAPGTGASLLAEATLWPILGRPVVVTVEATTDDEWRKKLLARLSTGPVATLIDNVRRRLDSASLSAAITADVFEDRILGTSNTFKIPVRGLWIATANNPALSNELTRRCVRIRLDARMGQPWMRSNFRHPDLRAWMTAERARLIWAALTLGQAWVAAGSPPATAVTMGNFEKWASVIGGVLDVAGIPGFLGNLSEFYSSADEETATWQAFITAWWNRFDSQSVGVADLWSLINAEAAPTADIIPLDLGDKGERSQRTRLGKLLHAQRDRVFDGRRITPDRKVEGAQHWRLVEV
jgi:putative DNA primase/helicase